MTFFASMDEVKINVFVSCEELMEEKSPKRNIEGVSGRLIYNPIT